MTARSQVSEQMAFDEQIIEDTALERALENRLIKKGSLDAVRKIYDEADEAAQVEIAKLELPEGGGSPGGEVPDHAHRHPGAVRDLRHQAQQPRADLRDRGRRVTLAAASRFVCPDCGEGCACSPDLGMAHEPCGAGDRGLAALPCSDCGAPSAGWACDLMGDGQAINGRSVCAAHLAGVAG